MKKYIKLFTILLVLTLFVITVIAPLKKTFTPSMNVSTGDPGGSGGSTVIMPPGSIAVDIEIKPETINLSSNGKFTVFVEFPVEVRGGYPTGFESLAGEKMKMKGKVQDIELVLLGEEVTIYIGGTISNGTDELPFWGEDTVRVIDKGN